MSVSGARLTSALQAGPAQLGCIDLHEADGLLMPSQALDAPCDEVPF